MNFILTTYYKDTWFAVPNEKKKEIAVQLYNFTEKYATANKFTDSYTFSDGRILSIWKVESFEEMMSILIQHPYIVNNYADYELDPVIEHKSVDKMIKNYGSTS